MRTKVPVALLATLCVLATVPAGSIAAPGSTGTQSVSPADTTDAPGTAGTAAATAAADATPESADVPAADAPNETAPADPDEDVLGWENGRWHNESIDVDASDGLDRNESARLLNRTMARVELVREVEFEEPVDLNFRTRAEVGPVFTGENVSDPAAVNAYYEALGLVGEDRDAVAVLRERQAGGARAFVATAPIPQLDLEPGDVTIVMDEGQAAYTESTLAHELVHTLQVQELDVPIANRVPSADRFDARRAVIEGEASHVTYRYQRRCDAEWDCVSPSLTASADFSPGAIGMLYLDRVRYGAGAEFVAQRHDAGGWSAVADTYDRFPASTEQVIHPDRYPTDAPQNVTVPDRSGDDWHPVASAGDTLGEAGLFTTLWFPSATSGQRVAVPPSAMFNESIRAQRGFPSGFKHPVTTGWDGDRLVPYLSESAGENETAFVWETVWDSADDAREFRDAYVRVLEHRGADPVEGHRNTFRIPDIRRFGDAFYVVRDGDRVVVVNAPTVDALPAVRNGSAPVVETPTPTATATAEPTPTATPSPTTPTATATQAPTTPGSADASETATGPDSASEAATSTDATGPGFGAPAALAALLAVVGVVAAGRRRRD